MGRRDSTDECWIETKDIVHKRDKGRCRLARIISAEEMLVLRKHAGSKLSRIDAAHFLQFLKDLICATILTTFAV